MVDCASGDSVDLIALKLTLDYDDDVGSDGQSDHSGGGSSNSSSSCDDNGYSSEGPEQPETGQLTGCSGSGDDEWVSGGEEGRRSSVTLVSDETESPKRCLHRRRRVLLSRGVGGRGGGPGRSSSSTRHAPTMCSLRVTPDGSKVIGLDVIFSPLRSSRVRALVFVLKELAIYILERLTVSFWPFLITCWFLEGRQVGRG